MTDTKRVKDNHIKVRVSEKERKELISNANFLNMNMSDYIRYCCMPNAHLTITNVPNFIKTTNLLNDIVQHLEGHTDLQTMGAIKNKITKYYKERRPNEKNR